MVAASSSGGFGCDQEKGRYAPFREAAKFGAIPLGEARITSAGTLPYQAIIHVAGINMLWFATRASVTDSVVNAMALVNEKGYQSVAFPLIGAGSGNRGEEWSLQLMLEAFKKIESNANVIIVRYKKGG